MPPRGLLHGLGNMAHHIPSALVELGIVLHSQEWVVVLIQDGPELDGGEAPPHYLDRAAVQPAEDARADAGDKEDPELLQVGVAVKGPGQHLLGGDKHAQRLGEQGNVGQELDFHRWNGRASGIFGDGESGAKVGPVLCGLLISTNVQRLMQHLAPHPCSQSSLHW